MGSSSWKCFCGSGDRVLITFRSPFETHRFNTSIREDEKERAVIQRMKAWSCLFGFYVMGRTRGKRDTTLERLHSMSHLWIQPLTIHLPPRFLFYERPRGRRETRQMVVD